MPPSGKSTRPDAAVPCKHAERAARKLVNQHTHPDPCTQFDAVLGVVADAIRLANAELKDSLLKPCRN